MREEAAAAAQPPADAPAFVAALAATVDLCASLSVTEGVLRTEVRPAYQPTELINRTSQNCLESCVRLRRSLFLLFVFLLFLFLFLFLFLLLFLPPPPLFPPLRRPARP